MTYGLERCKHFKVKNLEELYKCLHVGSRIMGVLVIFIFLYIFLILMINIKYRIGGGSMILERC